MLFNAHSHQKKNTATPPTNFIGTVQENNCPEDVAKERRRVSVYSRQNHAIGN